MTSLRLLVGLILIFLLGACTSAPPVKDYNLARTAIEAATLAQAPRHAPAYWSRAERAYQRAEEQYKNEAYDEARKSFREAKLFAERAENAAAIKVMREGGSQ